MVASPDVMADYCTDSPYRRRMSAAMQEDLEHKALEEVPDLPTLRTGAKNPEVFYMDFSHMLKDLDNKPTRTILFEDLEVECSGSRSTFDTISSSRWPPVSSYAALLPQRLHNCTYCAGETDCPRVYSEAADIQHRLQLCLQFTAAHLSITSHSFHASSSQMTTEAD